MVKKFCDGSNSQIADACLKYVVCNDKKSEFLSYVIN
jgi:hypothetical protein